MRLWKSSNAAGRTAFNRGHQKCGRRTPYKLEFQAKAGETSRLTSENQARVGDLSAPRLSVVLPIVPQGFRGLKIGSTESREIPVPDDLTEALRATSGALKAFEKLTPSHRKELLVWILDAKRPETRERRIRRTVKHVVSRSG